MHTAEDEFVAHIFHCEPSAGAICKTIEAACKVICMPLAACKTNSAVKELVSPDFHSCLFYSIIVAAIPFTEPSES